MIILCVARFINESRFIKDQKVKVGIALNPDTKIQLIHDYLDALDYVLIMSVHPGFGGQGFIKETLQKMKNLSNLSKKHNFLIGVDGGVNLMTIDEVYNTGIDITIVGSGLYGATSVSNRFNELMSK